MPDKIDWEKAISESRETPMSPWPTVREIAQVYLEKHSQPRGNRVGDEAILKSPLATFGDALAHEITHDAIDGYTEARQAGTGDAKPVSASTVRRELVALQAALNYGSRRGLVEGEKVFRFQKPAEGKPRDKWLTEKQETDVLNKMESASVSVRLFTKLALTYGCRRGAIMDLSVDQVHFTDGIIDFQNPNKAANRKRRTVVPITPDILDDLKELCDVKKLKVLDYDTPYQFKKFMASIGYDWVTPHVLKHTAITLMLRSGAKIEDVAKLTATDARTLQKVYRHHTVEELLTIAGARR